MPCKFSDFSSGVMGTLQSPGYPSKYPNNEDKTSTITVPKGSVIQVTFKFVNIESHRSCGYDYVMARDGDGSLLMSKTCGSGKPPPAPFTSKTNQIQIIFHSDKTVNKGGFKLTWKEVKRETIENESSGMLMSPNYPSAYPTDLHQINILRAATGKRIRITFTDLDLEDDRSCRNDFLKVRGRVR